MRGEDTLAGWKGGGGVNILEDARHCSVLYIRKYSVEGRKGADCRFILAKGSVLTEVRLLFSLSDLAILYDLVYLIM